MPVGGQSLRARRHSKGRPSGGHLLPGQRRRQIQSHAGRPAGRQFLVCSRARPVYNWKHIYFRPTREARRPSNVNVCARPLFACPPILACHCKLKLFCFRRPHRNKGAFSEHPPLFSSLLFSLSASSLPLLSPVSSLLFVSAKSGIEFFARLRPSISTARCPSNELRLEFLWLRDKHWSEKKWRRQAGGRAREAHN